MKSLYLAVYGTLRKGAINEIQGYKHLGQCAIPGRLYEIADGGRHTSWFPTIKPDEHGQVIGDLYSLESDACLEKFDRYESCDMSDPRGTFFKRKIVNVTLLTTTTTYLLPAWVYYMNENWPIETFLIPSGDWLNQETI